MMKRIAYFTLAIAIFTMVAITIPRLSTSAIDSKFDKQKALQETAMAYYRKGKWIQYDAGLKSGFRPPEEVTEQDQDYAVCSSFTFAVYYQTFGIRIPGAAIRLNAYGNTFYGKTDHDDVPIFYKGEELISKLGSDSNRAAFKMELLENLEIGDVISYYFDPDKNVLGLPDVGHAVFVYDYKYDANGNKTDAIILHSTSKYYYTTTKIPKGISYYEQLNADTGVTEGSIRMTTLTNILNSAARAKSDGNTEPASYFTVLRPIADDSTYNLGSCTGTSPVANLTCESRTVSYQMTESARGRVKNAGIQIEKTVDRHDGSNVNLGDILTYTIKITNNGTSPYKNLNVSEKIPVEVSPQNLGGGILTDDSLEWDSIYISPNSSYNIVYSVKVKNDSSNLGKTISATGNIDGISTGTVENQIANNLTDSQKNAIRTAYHNLVDNYSGAELIDKIYEIALDKNYNFSSLVLGARRNRNNSVNVINMLEKCDAYWVGDQSSDALIFGDYGPEVGFTEINQNNYLASGVLNNYFHSTWSRFYSSTCTVNHVGIRQYDNSQWINEDDIKLANFNDHVYEDTLETGDVLLIANTNDSVSNEDGYYAYIFIDDNFYGINKDKNENPLNVFYANNTHDKVTVNNLPTLYGRDFFAIIRPAAVIAKNNNSEDIPSDEKQTPSDADTSIDDKEKDGNQQSSSPAENKIENEGEVAAPNTGKATTNIDSNQVVLSIFGIILGALFVVLPSRMHRKKIGFSKKN